LIFETASSLRIRDAMGVAISPIAKSQVVSANDGVSTPQALAPYRCRLADFPKLPDVGIRSLDPSVIDQ
jgi:hypothetical protein